MGYHKIYKEGEQAEQKETFLEKRKRRHLSSLLAASFDRVCGMQYLVHAKLADYEAGDEGAR